MTQLSKKYHVNLPVCLIDAIIEISEISDRRGHMPQCVNRKGKNTMKKILYAFLLLLMPSVLMAAGKLPKGTYLWEDYDEARTEAIKEKKPILFVYTDLNTN